MSRDINLRSYRHENLKS